MTEDGGFGQPARLERPRTAGRRPPKVTSKVKTTADEPGLAPGVAPPQIIQEGAKDDDDDEMFEAPVKNTPAQVLKADEGEQHGKLVKELLAEQKKEEEKAKLAQEEMETRE